MSKQKLTDYFAVTKKDVIEKRNEVKKNNENFYEECLNENKCSCEKQKNSLKMKIKEIKAKVIEYENMVKTARLVIAEKDEEIDRLQKDVCLGIALAETVITTVSVQSPIEFKSFSAHFDPDQLKHLRAINSDQRSDSTFILNVIKFLYDGRLESIGTKTVCGRIMNADKAKIMMTPQTKLIVERIYRERLNLLGITELEQNVRRNKINKLIKDAFTNITKATHTKETCRRLQFD